MAYYIKWQMTYATERLLADPKAFALLGLIAKRQRIAEVLARQRGEELTETPAAYIGDHEVLGLSEQQYRDAKARLQAMGLAVFDGQRRRGTKARLASDEVFTWGFSDPPPSPLQGERKNNGLENGIPPDSERKENGFGNGMENGIGYDAIGEGSEGCGDSDTMENGIGNGNRNGKRTESPPKGNGKENGKGTIKREAEEEKKKRSRKKGMDFFLQQMTRKGCRTIDTPDFRAAYLDWLSARTDGGARVTREGIRVDLERAAGLGPAAAAERIRDALSAGWGRWWFRDAGKENAKKSAAPSGAQTAHEQRAARLTGG